MSSDIHEYANDATQALIEADKLLKECQTAIVRLEGERIDLLKAAKYAINALNNFPACPVCGFTKNDRSGQRHSDDCPGARLGKVISRLDGD
jgi:hypothetical protein